MLSYSWRRLAEGRAEIAGPLVTCTSWWGSKVKPAQSKGRFHFGRLGPFGPM